MVVCLQCLQHAVLSLPALFKGLPERKTLCGVTVRRAPAFEVKEVSTGRLRVLAASEQPLQWRIVCSGKADNLTTTRNGTWYIHVPEGCTVFHPEGAYTVSPSTVEVTVKLALIDQHDLHVLPPSLLAFDDWTDVRAVLDEHGLDEYVTASRLSELREKRLLDHIHSWSAGGKTGSVVAVVVVIVLFCLAGVALCGTIILWRRLQAERKKQQQQQQHSLEEGRNLNISITPASQPTPVVAPMTYSTLAVQERRREEAERRQSSVIRSRSPSPRSELEIQLRRTADMFRSMADVRFPDVTQVAPLVSPPASVAGDTPSASASAEVAEAAPRPETSESGRGRRPPRRSGGSKQLSKWPAPVDEL